jgi:hypothetical protein
MCPPPPPADLNQLENGEVQSPPQTPELPPLRLNVGFNGGDRDSAFKSGGGTGGALERQGLVDRWNQV